jgi:sigma-B regulation protein RsbU (phosphoserine phosphatase)
VPFRSLTPRLIAAVLGGCLAVYGAILVVSARAAREMLVRGAQNEARAVASGAAYQIAGVLRVAEGPPSRVAAFVEREPRLERGTLENLLRAMVGSGPSLFGAAAAFEPFAFDPGRRSFAPYCYRQGEALALKDLGAGSYDYFTWEWYREAKEKGRPRWSEPYFDEGGGNILMMTYSVPIRRGGRFVGVATADVALDWLQGFMGDLGMEQRGYAFLMSRSGRLVTHPDRRLILSRTFAELAAGSGDASLRAVAREMAAGGSAFVRTRDIVTGAPAWMAYRPLPLEGWSMAVVLAERELLADAERLQRILATLGLVGAGALAVVVVLLARSITRPLARLARATREVAAGRLDAELPDVSSRDEVGQLNASFREMQLALQQHVEEVKRQAAASERLESELRIAREIQVGLVPKASELRSERLRCDVIGVLEPAQDVGGDLFDILLRGESELCFAIGDVSGKGIPAALFMAVANTIFKAAARELAYPDQILSRVNRDLLAEGGANMFVTMLCGVLDTGSGRLSLSSGGHTPPVLAPRRGPPRFLVECAGTVLGVSEAIEFERVDLRLEPGDCLLLYTDGVTEAQDPEERFFGEERLLAEIARANAADARELVEAVLRAVHGFAHGASPADDIAILAIRRPAEAEKSRALRLRSDLAEVPRADHWLRAVCRELDVSPEAGHDFQIALEEVLVNVVRHGYGEGAAGEIEVRAQAAGEALRLEVRDRARPFNLLEQDPPPLDALPHERPEGGLGCHLVRRLMDRVAYAYEEGENRLVLERRRTA